MPITLSKRTLVSLSTLLLASACSSDEVDLGGGMLHGGTGSGRCAESTVIPGDVLVMQQSDVDALAGCEEITGDLTVALYADASLLPLSSLRVVGGQLALGAQSFLLGSEERFNAEGAFELERDRFIALTEQGWLESLEGLQALTRVGGLHLAYVLAADLHPLRNLESIQPAGVGTGGGSLSVMGARNLRDLSDLERVNVGDLTLIQNALESLDGPQLDGTMQGVWISHHPNLHDIQALASVTEIVGSLLLERTGLEDLDALAGLRQVDAGIALIENQRLSDISGLAQLERASDIQIQDNDLITSLPSFDALGHVDSIFLVDNAALEEFDLRGGTTQYGQFYELAGDELGEGHTTLIPAFRVEIQRNPSLRRLAMPAWPLEVQHLTIEDNPALTDIDLSATERVDFLSLTRNATLAHLSLPSLRTVDALEVVDNALLSPSVFASVKTFETVMSGNATTP